MFKKNIALGAFPGKSVSEAMILAKNMAEAGIIAIDHVQVCPQNTGILSSDQAKKLRAAYPGTQFRLHANAKVDGWSSLSDLSNIERYSDYMGSLAEVNRLLGATGYSIHAGLVRNADFDKILRNRETLEHLFGCEVAIEGMYPTDNDRYLVASWEGYYELFHARVPFALDLSHAQILAEKSGVKYEQLLADMLSSDCCMEIHVSGNDGYHDQHCVMTGDEFWLPLLDERHERSIIFTEEKFPVTY